MTLFSLCCGEEIISGNPIARNNRIASVNKKTERENPFRSVDRYNVGNYFFNLPLNSFLNLFNFGLITIMQYGWYEFWL